MPTTTRISPSVCAYPTEEEYSKLHIEIELPGVNKEDVKFKLHEDAFYIRATKGDIEYVGSYVVDSPVNAKEAKATFKDGLLTVEVPYRDPFAEAVEVTIQ